MCTYTFNRADLGKGVWLAAIPKPKQGCIKEYDCESPKSNAGNSSELISTNFFRQS